MKNTKFPAKRIILTAALVVLILLLIILLSKCGKQAEDVPAPETIAEPAVVASQPVAEATEALPEETTLPTEETTVPTEPTEEETTPPPTTLPPDDVFDPEEEADPDSGVYVEIPDPGTPENPYVEVVTTYPKDVESVNISKNAEISYLITGSAGSIITIADPNVTLTVGETTYTADEATGVLTADLSKLGTDPVVTLKNTSADAANCMVTLNEGVGGAGNPEILTDPVEIPVSLAENDANGYHYQWIATTDGTVDLKLKEEPSEVTTEETELTAESAEELPEGTETTEPAEESVVLEVLVTIGEETFRLSAEEDGILSFAVKKDTPVLIQVISVPWSDGSYPAVEETVLWKLAPDLGTKENPQHLADIEEIAVTLEANDEDGWHYLWTANSDGQLTLTPDENLTVKAAAADVLYQPETDKTLSFHMSRDQEVLIQAVAVEGIAVAEGKIAGQFQYDPGTPENPVMLESLDTITVALAEGDRDGHTLAWTAYVDGTLELKAETLPENFCVTMTDASGIAAQAENDAFLLEMKEGECVTILLTATADENEAYAAGEIVLRGVFTPAPGSSQDNPILLSDLSAAVTVTMDAKQTLYFSGMCQEMVATVEDAEGISLCFGDQVTTADTTGVAALKFPAADAEQPEETIVFSVTSDREKELTLVFAYPEGHANNPAQLQMGENLIDLEENDADGYLFNWTAECDGQLTLAMDEENSWQYQIDDLTAGTEGELRTSIQESVVAEETLEVKAGQQLRITVKTLDPEMPETMPAGRLTLTASFFDPLLGTEAKPVCLEADPEHSQNVMVPAGQTVYYTADTQGMILTFTGENVKLIHNGVELVPEGQLSLVELDQEVLIFAVSNTGAGDSSYTVTFQYPLGHSQNPAKLQEGENIVHLEAGREEAYCFTWKAEADGVLHLTMETEIGWKYVLRNVTEEVSTEEHCSGDEEPTAAEQADVSAGDELEIVLWTWGEDTIPGGELRFIAEFVPQEMETTEETIAEETEATEPEEIAAPEPK